MSGVNNESGIHHPKSTLGAGVPAPDFTLHSTPDQSVSLRDFRGQPVILAFYPADWSRCAATRCPSTMSSCRNSTAWARN